MSQLHSPSGESNEICSLILNIYLFQHFQKCLQLGVEHLRLLHVDEVAASSQLGVVEVGVECPHLLLVIGFQSAILCADNHHGDSKLRVWPPLTLHKVLHGAGGHVLRRLRHY